jgi:hypothetical protein
MSRDALRRVARKTEDVAGIGDDPLGPPGEKHLAVFVHTVLLFLRLQQIVGVDVFEPDEQALAAGARRLLDEIRDAVAERVDLNDELQFEPVALAHLDQPVEDRLPVPIAREIVVGDEEAEDTLREVGAHQALDIVGVAPARLAALHIDDRAKAALERAAAAGVEGANRLAIAPHDVGRQKRRHLPLAQATTPHPIEESRLTLLRDPGTGTPETGPAARLGRSVCGVLNRTVNRRIS